MADEKDSIDIFVIDSNPKRDYITTLREQGFKVALVSCMGSAEKQQFYDADKTVGVFIFGYGQCSGRGSGAIKKDDPVPVSENGCPLSGVELAKVVRGWSGKDKYIHIVAESALGERPFGCAQTWKELMEQGLINSYSTRDAENFRLNMKSIEDALRR